VEVLASNERIAEAIGLLSGWMDDWLEGVLKKLPVRVQGPAREATKGGRMRSRSKDRHRRRAAQVHVNQNTSSRSAVNMRKSWFDDD